MKTHTKITKVMVVLVSLTFILSSCSPWHYKNVRVKVDTEKTDLNIAFAEAPKNISETVTAQSVYLESETSATPQENNALVSTDKSVVTASEVKKESKIYPSQKAKVKVVKIKKEKKGIMYFTKQIMKNQLFKVKDVEKTALSGWIRIMVILFVVGFILLLIGIFLSIFLSGPFWWLFYAFGSLCILAGFVILILVLVGLI